MKKTKTVLATLSVATALTTFAPLATPVLADGSAATQVTQTQLRRLGKKHHLKRENGWEIILG